MNFTTNPTLYSGHLRAFSIEKFVPAYKFGTPLDGTIIRLPLRLDASTSRISSKALTPGEIQQLLDEFVKQEMEIALLFLSHLTCVVVMEVRDDQSWSFREVEIKRTPLKCSIPATSYQEVTVTLPSMRSQTWRLIEVVSSIDTCAQLLTQRLGYDAKAALEKEKLSPVVALAIPFPLQSRSDGRLFTFLPLPLPTGFPCHIHALFALTQARQNLWNCSEKGLVRGTRDEYVFNCPNSSSV